MNRNCGMDAFCLNQALKFLLRVVSWDLVPWLEMSLLRHCLFQVKIVRGLIYASKEQEETGQVLPQVLRAVNNADKANSELAGLIVGCLYQQFLHSLIMRPLNLKTLDQQDGTVTTLTFCLALRPPLLKLTPGLVNFLQDAFLIAESDNNACVAKFINLRTACIELLCTTMA
ncbi:transformation/transcription domain-associated protein-like [Trifolium medium]|uniref:Transformation/transcription domain-associated protein-like n=1 Tax=Trifolium medium TaxID=97028 RepID=A0A392M268_9FABA|nr:transformation/transcription domain-associated protein-like [Trifolium medium]